MLCSSSGPAVESDCCWCWCQVWIHLNQHPICTVRYSKAMKRATPCTGKQWRSSASSNFWHICFSAELAEYDDAAASYHRGVIVITGFQVLIYHHVHVQVATTTGTLGFFRKLWCIQLRNVQFPEMKTNMDASWQQMPSVTEPIFVDIVLHCQWAVIISISDLGSIGFRVDLNALLSVFTLDTAKSHKILSYLLLCGLGAGGRFLLPALTGLRVSFLFCSFLHIDFYIFVLRMTDADHRWR